MPSRQYTLLVVDDSASDRRIYRRFIASQSLYQFEVLEVGSAQAAIETCQRQAPDCVLLDYQLPDRDGLAVLDILKRDYIPVVFITGKPEPLVVTEAFRRGATKCMSKDTVTSASLQEAVFDALELSY